MSLGEQQGGLRPLSGRRCWVVGCGFLGSALAEACRAAGMEVLTLDSCRPADVQGEAAELAVLAAARALLEPELIFCCAATHGGDVAAYRATYLDLPQALHAACPGARLLFCSSSSVYGGQGGVVVAEESPCLTRSPRGQVLLDAERAVLAMGGFVARLVPLYGKERCELLRRFLAGEPELPGADSRWLNYVHQQDAARALLCLAQRALAGDCPPVVNVCGESFTKGEVYAALCRRTGLPRESARAQAGSRWAVSNHLVSSALLRSLGWVPQVEFLRWAEGFEWHAEPF